MSLTAACCESWQVRRTVRGGVSRSASVPARKAGRTSPLQRHSLALSWHGVMDGRCGPNAADDAAVQHQLRRLRARWAASPSHPPLRAPSRTRRTRSRSEAQRSKSRRPAAAALLSTPATVALRRCPTRTSLEPTKTPADMTIYGKNQYTAHADHSPPRGAPW